MQLHPDVEFFRSLILISSLVIYFVTLEQYKSNNRIFPHVSYFLSWPVTFYVNVLKLNAIHCNTPLKYNSGKDHWPKFRILRHQCQCLLSCTMLFSLKGSFRKRSKCLFFPREMMLSRILQKCPQTNLSPENMENRLQQSKLKKEKTLRTDPTQQNRDTFFEKR